MKTRFRAARHCVDLTFCATIAALVACSADHENGISTPATAGAGGSGPETGGPETGGSATGGTAAGGTAGAESPEPAFAVAAQKAAARLAAFLWQSETPEADALEILSAGPWGSVAEWSELDAEMAIRWMMTNPATRSTVQEFFKWWLAIPNLAELEKEGGATLLDAALRASFQKEALAFGVYETLDANGSFGSLLLAPYTFVDERLAQHYGIEGVAGAEPVLAAFPEAHRRGILSGAGVVTAFSSASLHSWPAKRSWVVLEPLLCLPVGTGVPMVGLQSPDPERSVKAQMMEFTAEPSCMGCHVFLNSIGFALIGFDSLGRWNPMASFNAEETRGWVPEQALNDQPEFADWPDLMQQLAARSEAQSCFTEQWLRFAAGTRTLLFREAAAVPEQVAKRVEEKFAANDFSLRELLVFVALEAARGLEPAEQD